MLTLQCNQDTKLNLLSITDSRLLVYCQKIVLETLLNLSEKVQESGCSKFLPLDFQKSLAFLGLYLHLKIKI